MDERLWLAAPQRGRRTGRARRLARGPATQWGPALPAPGGAPAGAVRARWRSAAHVPGHGLRPAGGQGGRPQRYGTQLRQVDACRWDYYLLDDPQRVEARRKRLGLPSLEEHIRGINDAAASENCPAAHPVAASPVR
ncbi:DUF6624 domain-containing protein [Massilia litorea]|uniref:DUF6624 domain-containing protein n=1 Tax=Massilia litorea TaxID=2769491 RepID=UPI0038B3CCA9